MLFTFLRVFGCARKMHFSEMLFSWPLNGCKLISVSILPSNRNFPEKRERAEGEEDAPARREREREREREEEERGDDRFAVRFRIRSTSQTQIVNPDREPLANPLRTQIANPDRQPRSRTPCEPRSRTSIANPDHEPLANPDREPRSQHRFVVPDREPRSVAPQNRLSSTPKPIVLPPFFSQFDRIMIFFFLGFICVSV